MDGRRLEGLAGSGLAYRQRLAASGRDLDWKKLAGAEGFEPSPSSLTVRCPTSWTTPQRRAADPGWRARQERRLRPKRTAEGACKIPRPCRRQMPRPTK